MGIARDGGSGVEAVKQPHHRPATSDLCVIAIVQEAGGWESQEKPVRTERSTMQASRGPALKAPKDDEYHAESLEANLLGFLSLALDSTPVGGHRDENIVRGMAGNK